MSSIPQVDPTVSTRFAFASFGGQLEGILARDPDGTVVFFTDTDDTAMDVTTCPMIYCTGTISASMDTYYQAQRAARRVTNREDV